MASVENTHPFNIDPEKLDALHHYLVDHQLIHPQANITDCAAAGPGNMNCTLRVCTDHKPSTLIVKQARPWVEKYPTIPAPAGRAMVEAIFYQTIQAMPTVAQAMPSLLHKDAQANILVLSDLGPTQDATDLYAKQKVPRAMHEANLNYLQALHRPSTDAMPAMLQNPEMCKLQALHTFTFPLDPDNGVDADAFTPGLQAHAQTLQKDQTYRQTCLKLQALYMQRGEHLLHGDFHPGSWMQTPQGMRYLDPEFCTLGPKEFDLGVMIAHYGLIENQKPNVAQMLDTYSLSYDPLLVQGYAGVEWMRRLIGVAQLPMQRTLEEKAQFLAWSRQWVLEAQAVC
jgi:5-methylthioribose kinase